MSTLPRRWSTRAPGKFNIFALGDKADIGVTRGVESVGCGDGGRLFSGESGVGGKGGREYTEGCLACL
jgi:hypothetical protein